MAEGEGQNKSVKDIMIILLLLIAVAGGGAWYFMQPKKNVVQDNRLQAPHFMQLEPFVVSLKSQKRARYLQIKLSLMIRNQEAIKLLETYRPLLRNELVRYLNTLTYTDVLKKETPDMIREASMERVNILLRNEQVALRIEDLVITDLVIQ